MKTKIIIEMSEQVNFFIGHYKIDNKLHSKAAAVTHFLEKKIKEVKQK